MQVSCVSKILIHPSRVQGSPLFRTVLLVLVLIGTGCWIARLTRPREIPTATVNVPASAPESGPVRIPYRLSLSAPAAEVRVGTLDGAETSAGTTGEIATSSADPVLTVLVRWRDPATDGSRRFAKLVLEIPGRETLEQVFDAEGDIDDVWELPAPGQHP